MVTQIVISPVPQRPPLRAEAKKSLVYGSRASAGRASPRRNASRRSPLGSGQSITKLAPPSVSTLPRRSRARNGRPWMTAPKRSDEDQPFVRAWPCRYLKLIAFVHEAVSTSLACSVRTNGWLALFVASIDSPIMRKCLSASINRRDAQPCIFHASKPQHPLA